MVNIKINDIGYEFPEGTTVLEAARQVGIDIPTLCYYKDLNEKTDILFKMPYTQHSRLSVTHFGSNPARCCSRTLNSMMKRAMTV